MLQLNGLILDSKHDCNDSIRIEKSTNSSWRMSANWIEFKIEFESLKMFKKLFYTIKSLPEVVVRA